MTLKSKGLKVVAWIAVSLVSLFTLLTLFIYVFQDRICNAVLQEVGKEFREPVYFKSADVSFWTTFPNIAINLNEVRINDAYLNSKGKGRLLSAERIRMVFNPWDLWNENYHIRVVELKKGELNLRTNQTGETNYHILHPSNDTSSQPLNVQISSFRTLDFDVNYLDSSTNQQVRTSLKEMTFSGNMSAAKFKIAAKGAIKLRQIKSGQVVMVNNKNVRVDMSLDVDAAQGRVQFPASRIYFAEIPLNLGGIYSPDSLNISLTAKGLPLAEVINKLSIDEAQKQIDAYEGNGTVDFSMIVSSNKNHPKTAFDARFNVKNGELREPVKKTRITHIALNGSYLSQGNPLEDELKFTNLKFTSVAGPFQGNLTIKNFVNPEIKGKAKGGVDLGVVNKLFRNTVVDQINGTAKINAEFDLSCKQRVEVHRVNGDLELIQVRFKAKEDHRVFQNIQGKFILQGSEVTMQNASLDLNQSDLNLSGRLGNIYNYLYQQGNLSVDCALNSRNIQVEDLGSTSKREKMTNVGKQFVLPKNMEGTVSLRAGKIGYENHSFEQFTGMLSMKDGVLNFPHISLRNGAADLRGNLTIQEDAPEHLLIHAQLASQNLHFAPMFKEWNNFDQSVITADQIDGLAQAEVDFFAPFDLIGGIDLNQLKVQAHMSVFNGSLKNVKAFDDIAASLESNAGKLILGKKNIANFKTKLQSIDFQTLENTFYIEHGVLTIPNMRIQSSALDLELSGTHSFKQEIDYRFKFGLRALLGEDRDASFGTVLDDGTGVKIHLRMYGTLDNPILEWDKAARKAELKETLVQEKETVKSMLKSEFGVFKKDTTVKEFQEVKTPKEVVKMNINPKKEQPKEQEANSPNPKENKLKAKLNQWKTEQNQSNVSVVVKKG